MAADRTNQTINLKDAYILPESAECLESLTYKGDAAVSKVIDGDTRKVLNKFPITPEDEIRDVFDDMARDIALMGPDPWW